MDNDKYRNNANNLSGLKYLFNKNETENGNETCTNGRRI